MITKTTAVPVAFVCGECGQTGIFGIIFKKEVRFEDPEMPVAGN
jgi:hypothetical protein